MLKYAVFEIAGKQYKISAGQKISVDFLGVDTEPKKKQVIEAQALLICDDNKIKIGKPFLADKIKLQILDNIKLPKIRVAKFHAKANYRRVTGIRPRKTLVELV